jgi:hypothetical protein
MRNYCDKIHKTSSIRNGYLVSNIKNKRPVFSPICLSLLFQFSTLCGNYGNIPIKKNRNILFFLSHIKDDVDNSMI